MRLRKNIWFVFLLLSSTGKAQPSQMFSVSYCIHFYKADSFYNAKQYDSSRYHFRHILYKQPLAGKERQVYLKVFRCFRDMGQMDSAYHYMLAAVNAGLHCLIASNEDTARCNLDSSFLVFSADRNALLANKYRENNKQNVFDQQLYDHIQVMVNNDQAARLTDHPVETAKGLNRDSLYAQLKQVDSLNTLEVKMIIDKYGWPGYTVLGSEGDNALWAMVQHADHDVAFQERVLKLIEKSILENNTNRRNYAYLYDRICVNRGLPQLFGTQSDRSFDDIRPHPLADSAHVNYYRYACGLGTIEEYFDYFKKRYNNKNKVK